MRWCDLATSNMAETTPRETGTKTNPAYYLQCTLLCDLLAVLNAAMQRQQLLYFLHVLYQAIVWTLEEEPDLG
jgi:hypothetical protein